MDLGKRLDALILQLGRLDIERTDNERALAMVRAEIAVLRTLQAEMRAAAAAAMEPK